MMEMNYNSIYSIKSIYFIRKIFNNLNQKRKLEIVNYSNRMQNILKLRLNDYKKYFWTFTPIEIEVKPSKECKTFICINKGEESYYHIYFNDNKEEIKRNYLNEYDNVSKIKIIIDWQSKSLKGIFWNCGIESIDFKKFYRNNISDMSSMFYECSSLKKLNLTNFITYNVINMSHMFHLFIIEIIKSL